MTSQAIFSYAPKLLAHKTISNCSTICVMSRWFGSWNFQMHRKPHTVRELSNRYDGLAARWDNTLDKFDTADAYRIILSRALPSQYILGSETIPRVLDCGTGTGAFLSAYADATGNQSELHGIDISSAMLEKAEEVLTQQGQTAEFRQGEVTDLPYPDAHFDVVLAAHVVEHTTYPHDTLAEMYRVLKPDGYLIVCVTRESAFGRAIQFKWRTHVVDETRATDWLKKAGFKSIKALRALSVKHFDKMSIACVSQKPESKSQLKNRQMKEVEHV